MTWKCKIFGHDLHHAGIPWVNDYYLKESYTNCKRCNKPFRVYLVIDDNIASLEID